MGTDKLALPFHGQSFGSQALSAALQSRVKKVFLLTKENDSLAWVPEELIADNKCVHVPVPLTAEGQSATLRIGVSYAIRHQASALIILLADQPFVKSDFIDELCSQYERNPNLCYVAATGEGIPKPPILFSDRLFSSLLDLTGDKGARDILRDGSLHGLHLPAPDPLLFADADTMEAYNRLKQMKKKV